MARLAITGALLIMFVLALAEASVYQTIITTTEFDDEPNASQSEMCRRQLSGVRLGSCRTHLKGPRSVSIVEQQCCQELRQVNDPKCRCEALRQIVPGYSQQELQETAAKVRGLADSCRMQELRSCKIRGHQGF